MAVHLPYFLEDVEGVFREEAHLVPRVHMGGNVGQRHPDEGVAEPVVDGLGTVTVLHRVLQDIAGNVRLLDPVKVL